MGSILFILSLIVVSLAYDIVIRLIHVILPSSRVVEMVDVFFRNYAHRLLYYTSFFAGVKIRMESDRKEPLPDSFIVISNHQSLADILILVEAFPHHNLKFIAKNSLKYGIPVVSLALRAGKHILIPRSKNFRNAITEIARRKTEWNKNYCPIIFPEGTRSRTGTLGRFHSAGFRLLLKYNKIPVVSVAVEGGYKITKFFDLFKRLKNLDYYVRILSVYPHTEERSEAEKILKSARREIEDQLSRWRSGA